MAWDPLGERLAVVFKGILCCYVMELDYSVPSTAQLGQESLLNEIQNPKFNLHDEIVIMVQDFDSRCLLRLTATTTFVRNQASYEPCDSLDVNHALWKVNIIDKYSFGRLEINVLCSVCCLGLPRIEHQLVIYKWKNQIAHSITRLEGRAQSFLHSLLNPVPKVIFILKVCQLLGRRMFPKI